MGGVINWFTEAAKSGFHQFFIKPIEWGMDQLIPDFDIPDYDKSPAYGGNQVLNSISEGIPVARCYGLSKVGANKIRFNAADASDLRVIAAFCVGEIHAVALLYINDILWVRLTGAHTKTDYTGTRAQTPDGRFTDKASAYRGIAYTALTFVKTDSQTGSDPHITAAIQGMLCTPFAGGAKSYTRNPSVILYDWYTEVEGYSAGDINVESFQSLEALCDETPDGDVYPRYRFDFAFDTDITINDAKKLIWRSFNGRVIMSQGKLKAVWDSSQMEDGAGGLTAKTVSHAFTVDNIVKDSLTWHQPERPNIVRIHYIEYADKWKKTTVEVKDEHDINLNGEILYEEKCWFILAGEVARRRAQCKFNKFKYTDYVASLSALSGAGDLEVYDLVTLTHTLPGWTAKQFVVTQKGEDQYGRMQFVLDAYYSGVYDDAQPGTQPGYEPDLPNPFDVPFEIPVGDITLTEVTSQTFHWSPAVNVTFPAPTNDSFWSYVEVWISTDDVTFTFYGITSSGDGFTIETTGAMFQPGATLYVKLLSVSSGGVKDSLTNIESKSIVLSSVIRLGNFYVHANSFGNAAIEADATILLDSANTWIRVGASASDHVLIDGDYSGEPAIRSSNYVSGFAGAGFLLKSDLLEVGNIACRGIFRTAVFQKDVISAVGGNVFISKSADVLDADMSASDSATLKIEGNITFTVGDILRIKDGTNDEWLEVTNIGSAPTYTVTRDKGAQYGADANPAWKKGATVVNYGQNGDGAIYLTASETNAPYIGVVTHAGSPWSSVTTRLRIGNLNGFLGYASDLYGIAIGETNAYLKYDPTNGLRIKGLVEIIGNPSLQNMLMNGGFEDTDGTNAYYWATGAGITTETSGGDGSNKYLKLTRSGSTNYAYHYNPDGSHRWFEVNEGEVYEFGGSIKSDGTCAGYIILYYADKDKANADAIMIGGTDVAWTTKSGTYTIPAGIKFIRYYVAATTADGWAAFDNVYLRRTELVNFPSDVNLVGYWSLDDRIGSQAVDNSGHGNIGTLNGDPQWADGISGKCLDFDGTGDYVSVPDDALLDFGTGSFSGSYWINFNGVDSQQRWSLGKGEPWAAGTPGWGIAHVTTADPIPYVGIYFSDGVSVLNTTWPAMDRGTWYHLLFIVNRDDDTLKTYLNAEYQNSVSISGYGTVSNAEALLIGAGHNTAQTSDCKIDEVRLYDRALTANEIKALYLYPSGNKSSAISGGQTPWASGSDVTKIDGGNIYTNTITASHINGAGFGTLTITSGKIAINTIDALEIQAGGNINVLAGGDIELEPSDTDPSVLNWGDAVFLGARANGTLAVWPDIAGTRYFRVGWDAVNNTVKAFSDIFFRAYGTVWIDTIYDANHRAQISVTADGSHGYIDLEVKSSATAAARTVTFRGGDAGNISFGPDASKLICLGNSSYCWDTVYADDYDNIADFYHLDSKDDLAAIKAIKGSGIISDVTGLELIDDSTIPEWMLSRHKSDGEEMKIKDLIISAKTKGDVMYNSDGKPYLSLKLMASLCMGAIRQLDAKIEKIINP